MSNRIITGFLWGLTRGIGNTASKRTTEYIGNKVINPKSKFRKRIEKFDLGGSFNSGRNKLMVLIEMFHEEYVINGNELPMMQLGTYLHKDIGVIESKIKLFESYILNEETERPQFEIVTNLWNNVKTSL
jgi:hypothetical protein